MLTAPWATPPPGVGIRHRLGSSSESAGSGSTSGAAGGAGREQEGQQEVAGAEGKQWHGGAAAAPRQPPRDEQAVGREGPSGGEVGGRSWGGEVGSAAGGAAGAAGPGSSGGGGRPGSARTTPGLFPPLPGSTAWGSPGQEANVFGSSGSGGGGPAGFGGGGGGGGSGGWHGSWGRHDWEGGGPWWTQLWGQVLLAAAGVGVLWLLQRARAGRGDMQSANQDE